MAEWIDISKAIPWVGLPNIYLIDQDSEKELYNALSSLGFKIFYIEGNSINSEETFFLEVSRVLKFPDYFGKNWDAFHDCFGDFVSIEKGPVALIWRDATSTIKNSLKTFLKITYELLSGAAEIGSYKDVDIEPVQIELFILGKGKDFVSSPVVAPVARH
ncbi:MAG: barstar family protein [Candidatus Aminicenantes bacterium]|jgi:RNAse (barnase) inhibitor barstar